MTLAVVDDDKDVRTALARLLRCLGHEVRTFASADEFEAANPRVDCAIVDVRMPGRSGLELCERLLESPAPIPVVLISGDTDVRAGDPVRPLSVPALAKPFDDVVLLAAISDAIAAVNSSRDGHAP